MHNENIKANEAHLWVASPSDITDQSCLSAYWEMITSDERQRHNRFHFQHHRHQFLVSRGLLRVTLSHYLAVPPDQIEFTTNSFGRPELSHCNVTPPYRFNLSHTDELIILGVTKEQEIGVDVEYISRKMSSFDIARRYFSPQEADDVDKKKGDEKRHRFFDYWTLKESYIKARGKGLSIPLDLFSFTLSPHKPIAIHFNHPLKDNLDWQFFLLSPTPLHRAAISIGRQSSKECGLTIYKTIPLKETIPFKCPVRT